MKSCVTISLVPSLKGGPWVFWDDLEQSLATASELGFDGVELFTAEASIGAPNSLSALLAEYKLELAAVGTGAGKVIKGLTLTSPDPEIRKKSVSFIKEMILFGADHGAPTILGSMQGNSSEKVPREIALKYLSESLEIFGELADLKGTYFIYEPLNRYETNLFNHLGTASTFINNFSTNGVKLLADLFHMNIEEQNLPDSLSKSAANIGHVHFADSNRKPVGFGHTDMQPIAAALKQINYKGFLSAEAFAWPDPKTAAQQTIDSFKKFFY
mgnify:CR=1 FL=1